MKAYCDASFLASLYMMDSNSERAAALGRQPATTWIMTPLSELELTNAFQLRVFRKELTPAEARAGLSAFQNDLAAGVYTLFPISTPVFAHAGRLARKHTRSLGTRSLDILHVASAVAAGADTLLSFDLRQRRLARAIRLATQPRIRSRRRG